MIKTFYLKQSDHSNDVILKFDSSDYFEACEYFASIKNLSLSDLLQIYVVVS